MEPYLMTALSKHRALACVLFMLVGIVAEAVATSQVNGTGPEEHATWQPLCAPVRLVHTVKAGQTPRGIMEELYQDIDWKLMWSLVVLCNGPGLERVDYAKFPDKLVGKSLRIPYFNIPTLSVPASNTNAPGVKCGCAAPIQVKQPTRLLKLVRQSYPRARPLTSVALMLHQCNPGMRFVGGVVDGNQELQGICMPADDMHAIRSRLPAIESGACSCGTRVVEAGDTVDSILQAACPMCKVKEGAGLFAFCNMNTYDPSEGLQEGTTVRLPCPAAGGKHFAEPVPAASAGAKALKLRSSAKGRKLQQTYCSVDTCPFQNNFGHTLYKFPSGCPWYSDGCSGPSAGLQYQDVLGACCNFHDFCYSCGWRVMNTRYPGWGRDARRRCDVWWRDNGYAQCAITYPVRGWWDSSNQWNQEWCKATVTTMFKAVWAYQEANGGVVRVDNCPGDYWKFVSFQKCFWTC